jgi:hypothetical protein
VAAASQQRRLNPWGKGIYMKPSGHLCYSSPMSVRGKYVHRKVVEDLIEETSFSLRQFIPYPYEVHHMDFNKTNNEPSNFLLLDHCFHSSVTASGQQGRAGKFEPRWKPAPEWKLFDSLINLDDEVPF